jgi:predicted MFS family arabinose efflux permease
MTVMTETKPRVFFLMATATGICVANLYYCQPLLGAIGADFHQGVGETGWVPTLTQAGYAFGMLFLVPLGDMAERRKLAVAFTLAAALCSALLALASHFPLLLAASFFLGLSTMTPQILIPFAANLAKPEERGKVIGTMMSGLLLGILLARSVSGFLAAFGWRFLYGLVAAVLALLALTLAFFLPKAEPTYRGTYRGLLRSIAEIAREQPVLREASFFGAMLFGAFSAFWATLIYLMEDLGRGPAAVGLFGLLGAGSALLSPVVGAWMDRTNARVVTGRMIWLTALSFAVYFFSSRALAGLALGVVLMDIGVQSGHISNQSRIFALLPHARSRIQTVYMFSYFVGGSIGSLLGAWGWDHYRWPGVCGAALGMLALAGLAYARGSLRGRSP